VSAIFHPIEVLELLEMSPVEKDRITRWSFIQLLIGWVDEVKPHQDLHWRWRCADTSTSFGRHIRQLGQTHPPAWADTSAIFGRHICRAADTIAIVIIVNFMGVLHNKRINWLITRKSL
jgi:hypothetical protein